MEDLAADQLERFPLLAVFEIVELEAAGFEVVPTFRAPHVTVTFAGNLDELLSVLVALTPRIIEHPYHDREPDERSRK